ncbi:oligopeptidase family protein [Apiospora arundinis]|uniref:Dipeptidyl-peptidase V n=1 Tax=Apiospora arundinis TaxID=335852 RepID=A0ABR2IV98_9PEZI
MVIVPKFTPEILISAPRRAPAVPNRHGTLALFAQSTHTIGEEKTLKEVRVMKVESGESQQLTADEKVHDFVWFPDSSSSTSVVWLKKGDDGVTSIEMVDAAKPSESAVKLDVIEAPVDNLKLKALKDGSVAFVVTGLADDDGELYNPEKHKKLSSIRIHDEYDVRIWDSYTKPQKHAVFYTTLAKNNEGAWKLSTPLKNALKGSPLKAPIGMYEPDDPLAQFDICESGLAFAAHSTQVKDYRHGNTSAIYYLPLPSFTEPSATGPQKIPVAGDKDQPSYCSHPRISPDGTMIAFLRAPFGRLSQQSVYVHQLENSTAATDVFATVTGKEWGLIPGGLEFSADGHFLYIDAEDCARVGLYRLDLQPNASPKTLLRDGSVKAYYPLAKDKEGIERVFVSSANIVEPSIYQILEVDNPEATTEAAEPWVVSKASHLENLGLSRKQVSEIYFEGAGDYCVQAWVVKPRDFDPEKNKYPLSLIVHGGPQAAQLDDWSYRWNLALWAEQGYIVVAPNITGSTGFGLEYTEAVQDNWGGRPYDDLVNCVEFVKDMPGIDMDNAVASGASYGGYMMNWIQGHELGRRFKAIVCHDGVYDVPTSVIMSDYVDEDAEYGGPPLVWKNNDGLERYNPARPDLLCNWTTPMLVVHSDNDYRVPVTDGIAAFHVLRALGTPARFVSFPDENHWVLKPENSLQWHRVVFEWINRWSGVAEKEKAKKEGAAAAADTLGVDGLAV